VTGVTTRDEISHGINISEISSVRESRGGVPGEIAEAVEAQKSVHALTSAATTFL
jgi:hypothetical protein